MIPEHIKKEAERLVHARSASFYRRLRAKLLAMKMAEKYEKLKKLKNDNLN